MPYLPTPQSDTEKNEFLAPDFPADSSQFFRVHGFTSADRQMPTAMRNPFAWTNVSSGKKRLFCNLATRWNKILQFVPSFPIYGWLTWWCDFFPVGPAFKDHPQEFGQKKVQPLGFYFWHLRLGLFKSPFFGWWSWTYVVVPFCKDKCIFSKNICFVIWARIDTKFLNSSHHVLSVDDWPGDATFFLWANLWRLSASIQSKKGPAPWILFLTPAPRPLQVTFLVGEDEHVCLYPFARTTVFSAKKHVFCNLGARWHKILEFVPSCPISGWLAWWCDFFPVGPTFEDHPQVFSQKKVQPLGFYFWPLRLGLLKLLVKVNICVCTLLQSHVKNHTPSINHGTFFPGVWHLDMF